MKKTGLLIIILTMFVLTSCSILSKLTTPSSSLNSKAESSSKAVSSVVPTAKNALTGETIPLSQATTNRPMGIMVSNIQKALPQSGLSQADICYEVVAEGGITRIFALFYNWNNLPKIGPVRSARDYYIDFAQGHNAIFVHFGESYLAQQALTDRKINDIDGMSVDSAFWRDQARVKSKGLEHSAYTNAATIQKGITIKNIKVAAENGKQTDAFDFSSPEQKIKPTFMTANKVTVPFSDVTTGVFDYLSAENVYAKSEFGSPQIDENTNTQLKVTNVIVLFTDIQLAMNPNTNQLDPELMSVAMQGGSGYYISNGGAQEISWEKGQPTASLKLFASDHTSLKINAGKSWICFVENGRKSLVKFG